MTMSISGADGLRQRLAAAPVLCAEGYLFELERRGYLQAGAFVPEVVVEHPEAVAELHREFVHAGSDIVEAFTYYAHREKLRVIGKADLLEPMNRQALAVARSVARESGTLLAGNICNTNAYVPGDAAARREVAGMFAEQVGWAAEEGAELVIAETFWYAEEALLALETVRRAGLPAVVTLAPHRGGLTREGWSYADACARLVEHGADVVGLNCTRGPATMLPLLGEVVAAAGEVPVAALPVPYRTTPAEPTFQSLRDPAYEALPDGVAFPIALEPFTCNRYEVADFTRQARALGVSYFGLCCGAAPHHVRSMAEALGRTPAASRYSADMSKHAFMGTDPALAAQEAGIAQQL